MAFCTPLTSLRAFGLSVASPISAICPVSLSPATCSVSTKRARATTTWTCSSEPVDGGTIPEDGVEVQFFGDKSSETPDKAPSLSPDPASVIELPLFPLQLVVNPGSNFPLHIFEMRYRLMFNSINESSTASKFGIVLYEGKSNSLALIGCATEITEFEPLPDGRIMTNNIGRERFRIVRIIEEKPYIRAKVEPLKDTAPSENLMPVVFEVWQVLQDVLRLSNKLYDKSLELAADLKRLAPGTDGGALVKPNGEQGVPEGWPSPKLVEEFSFAVCQILDMPLKEQQIMLQTTETGVRLKRQLQLLGTARQYLAAQVTIKEAGLKDV